MDSPLWPARFRSHRFLLSLLGLAAVGALVSLFSMKVVHPWFSWNRDEPVYLWHADVLSSGSFEGTLGNPVSAFRPWLSGVGDGYYSQYTIGWPALLAGAKQFLGSAAVMVVAGTVLFVVSAALFVREVLGRERLACVIAMAALASPVVVIQSGLYLPYLMSSAAGMLSLTAAWSGLRRSLGRRVVVAGLILAWLFIARPYDAILWGAVLVAGAAAFAEGSPRDRLLECMRLWPIAVAGLAAVAIAIAYNLRITGEALTFPITATDPLDTFGFGERRLMPGLETVDYGLGKALSGTARNGAFFVVFLTGSIVSAVLAVGGAWIHRRSPSTWILMVCAAAFPVGYFVFWGNHISSLTARFVGSIYYLPSVVPVLALAALGGIELWKQKQRVAIGVLAASVVLTIPVMVSRLDLNRRISDAQEPWTSSVENLDSPSLVIVAESGPYLLYKNPVSRNSPLLDDMVLYATDLGPGNFDTLRAHPERESFLQVASLSADDLLPRESPNVPVVELLPMSELEGENLLVTVRFVHDDPDDVVVPFLEIDGDVRWGEESDVERESGDGVSAEFELGPTEMPQGRGTVRVGFGIGRTVEKARADAVVRWELSVEATETRLTALLPAQESRRFPIGDEFKWLVRSDLSDAVVEAIQAD